MKVELSGSIRNCKLLICTNCGNKFPRDVCHISPKFNFCTIECTREFQTTRKIVNCATCGKERIRPLNQVLKHKIFYCDQKCRVKHISAHYTPRQILLVRRERGYLGRLYGTSRVSIEMRKIAALLQVQRKGFKKNTLLQIGKGKTYEAYI